MTIALKFLRAKFQNLGAVTVLSRNALSRVNRFPRPSALSVDDAREVGEKWTVSSPVSRKRKISFHRVRRIQAVDQRRPVEKLPVQGDVLGGAPQLVQMLPAHFRVL